MAVGLVGELDPPPCACHHVFVCLVPTKSVKPVTKVSGRVVSCRAVGSVEGGVESLLVLDEGRSRATSVFVAGCRRVVRKREGSAAESRRKLGRWGYWGGVDAVMVAVAKCDRYIRIVEKKSTSECGQFKSDEGPDGVRVLRHGPRERRSRGGLMR